MILLSRNDTSFLLKYVEFDNESLEIEFLK